MFCKYDSTFIVRSAYLFCDPKYTQLSLQGKVFFLNHR